MRASESCTSTYIERKVEASTSNGGHQRCRRLNYFAVCIAVLAIKKTKNRDPHDVNSMFCCTLHCTTPYFSTYFYFSQDDWCLGLLTRPRRHGCSLLLHFRSLRPRCICRCRRCCPSNIQRFLRCIHGRGLLPCPLNQYASSNLRMSA